ncbi:HAD family hydrolase [Spiribacter halobius]|uniref:Phosphoglycolate phosphatase n=1 Tax=Sediminicurvatus halobius TaxID=2182432 RepID=A0A2U2N2M7_9GAMM|nr:HAD-IA family hydrolase [Spiribacter halobius]PWG63481.1 phosphoglycolate phosphatase [Spiribacter halobius]UEX79649.1 HAD-IA family hydrolase [Spiribacter halobius]
MRRLPLARAVLLDLDGTLFDTAPDLISSLNALRREEDLPPLAAAQLASAVSHGSAPMIRRGFDLAPDDPRFEPLRQRFLALYRERLSCETQPFDGMEELLHTLERGGVPWGIVTNKPGWLTEPLVAALGYGERPHCVVSGDDLRRRKPDPYQVLEGCRRLGLPPRECVFVGDAERDVEAGRRAGTLTLVALFGYLSAEDRVTRWGADGLIGHPQEIERWLAADAWADHRNGRHTAVAAL